MRNLTDSQSGFTLMEIVVATTIFVFVVSAMMVLFNHTLRINRQVDAQRQVAQGTRNFTEFLIKEIRNGKIDYVTTFENCDPDYSDRRNTALAIVNQAGEPECFYLSGNTLYIEKAGLTDQINPKNFSIDPDTFRFLVTPTTDAHPANPPYPGVQPVVTISAQFAVQVPGVLGPIIVPYQTSISPDVYDIPHE